MRRSSLFLILLLLTVPAVQAQTPPAAPAVETAPDTPEPGSAEKIKEYTTAPEFLPESVSYVPDSATVPSPTKALGRLVGSPDELHKTAEVNGYFKTLAVASDRVRVETIGTSEEGREMILAAVSDAANLADLARFKETTEKLSDPRRTSRDEARHLAEEGKVFYWLLGGLHSPETGSPEMLMELAYRLAVSERPEIQEIRRNCIVLITPVVEVDGRDRQVEWYYRHLRGKKLPFQELSEFDSPPYWGQYILHDNNRDGMQLALALSRAVNATYFAFHPQVMHDLHESVPLMYISTGHGPYSHAVDPVTISEWTALGDHDAGGMAALGLPGVWTWAFWDGWWPGYLVSVGNNHHGIGRFYETFGNSMAGTFERDLSEQKVAGKAVTEVQWYRPWPPGKKFRWSLRDNTNYMEAGVLQALGYAAAHRRELLENFWIKGKRSLDKGRTEAPYAWIFPPDQRDPGRLAYMVHQLRAQRIEVHRLDADLTLGAKSWPAGSTVVRMDQPYRNAAVNYLEEQKFPADEPNAPYEDVAWTWPLLDGVAGEPVADRKALDAPMTLLTADPAPRGRVDGTGDVFLLRDTGQNAFLQARVLLGIHQVDAAEAAFQADGVTYPPGSWLVQAPRDAVEGIAAQLGLSFHAVAALPNVRRHVVDLPRLALLHTWTDTQDAGWARYTLDQAKVDYTLINDDDMKRGGLEERFDVILFPRSRGDFAGLVHGIDPKYGPLAYTKTPEFPSHGIPDASEDITGGMGFQGVVNLEKFLRHGGVLIAISSSGALPVEGGLVRGVGAAGGGFNTPGSELRAKVLRPEHPLAYGYEERTAVFRGNGPIWDVDNYDRRRVIVQFGTKEVEAEKPSLEIAPGTPSEATAGRGIEVEDIGAAPAKAEEKKDEKKEGKGDRRLVLSGFVRGEDAVDGKPAVLDLPVGKGRVILFSFNPLHRYLNHADFRFVYNALLNWNDLPE
jgi:Zinc carboxypeptidase